MTADSLSEASSWKINACGIFSGPYALVSGYTIKVKRPDYNEATNVGSRDYRIYKRETLFYIHNGVLAGFPVKKKDLTSIFSEDAQKRVARLNGDLFDHIPML